jgi:hypothetical protein
MSEVSRLTEDERQFMDAYLKQRASLLEEYEHIRTHGTPEEFARIDGYIDGFDLSVMLVDKQGDLIKALRSISDKRADA